jgi:hypothetical protein
MKGVVLRNNSILIALDANLRSKDNSQDYNPAAEGHFDNDTIYALAPPCAVSHWHAVDTAGHCCPFPSPLSASSSGAGSRKPLSAQTAGPLLGTSCEAQTCDQRYPAYPDMARPSGEVPASLQAELAQWDKASEEAWAMIDQWETEDR